MQGCIIDIKIPQLKIKIHATFRYSTPSCLTWIFSGEIGSTDSLKGLALQSVGLWPQDPKEEQVRKTSHLQLCCTSAPQPLANWQHQPDKMDQDTSMMAAMAVVSEIDYMWDLA
jgi:hypothetical protein